MKIREQFTLHSRVFLYWNTLALLAMVELKKEKKRMCMGLKGKLGLYDLKEEEGRTPTLEAEDLENSLDPGHDFQQISLELPIREVNLC